MTPLTIERLLYFNSIAFDWGKGNELEYKDWVKKIIKNPILTDITINKYAKNSLIKLNSKIEQNRIQDPSGSSHITREIFWKGQKIIFDYYMFAIDKLLALSDEDLNHYLQSNLGGDVSYEFSNWWNKVSSGKFDKKISKFFSKIPMAPLVIVQKEKKLMPYIMLKVVQKHKLSRLPILFITARTLQNMILAFGKSTK